ncbi:hypothetical protein Ahy_B10g101465 [Arachis hypogaea]|uniref:LRR receptor-like serine/threonine-protein kinase n=1 Tax=Arachis hypogaea TaxID=3818 RepID=A0A444WZJ5_ARAHY|nr:hypothetical protein Ahy_B10g101465 [Arachis hypogaea]
MSLSIFRVTCKLLPHESLIPTTAKLILGGTLAPSLGNLTSTDIYLHGEIPRQRDNNLGNHIPVEMINCSSLQVIILLYNNLTVKFPSWLSSMEQLTQLGLVANDFLDFYKNYLGGALIILIGNLSTNLIKILLDMGLNQRSGRISGKIENLFGLGSLFMDENVLEGPFSNSIGKLKNLVIIFLSKNNLSSNISTGIGNLTILAEVYIDFNAFEL